jgi:hypothetical protein
LTQRGRRGIRQGWPQVLAGLDTLLETGEPLAVAS